MKILLIGILFSISQSLLPDPMEECPLTHIPAYKKWEKASLKLRKLLEF